MYVCSEHKQIALSSSPGTVIGVAIGSAIGGAALLVILVVIVVRSCGSRRRKGLVDLEFDDVDGHTSRSAPSTR